MSKSKSKKVWEKKYKNAVSYDAFLVGWNAAKQDTAKDRPERLYRPPTMPRWAR